MSSLQKELYKATFIKNFRLLNQITNKIQKSFNTSGKAGNKVRAGNILMELRKILNHPYLVSGVEPPYPEFDKMDDVEEEKEKKALQTRLIQASGKLTLLSSLLKKLKEQGHKVLIFSQMTKLLTILEDFLIYEEYEYLRLDGDTPTDSRQVMVDEFNRPDSDKFIFLLSTRAGGLGLNLTGADTVIIYDIDFNPHQDMQALSRAHRIGQSKPVLVLKLVTKKSAEERMNQIANKKQLMDHLIIEQLSPENEDEDIESTQAKLKAIDSVLKYGAKELFEEDSGNISIKRNPKDNQGQTEEQVKAVVYDDRAVMDILDRSQIVKVDKPKDKTENVFAFARVWNLADEPRSISRSPEVETTDQPPFDDAVEDQTPDFWSNLLKDKVEAMDADSINTESKYGRGLRVKKPLFNHSDPQDDPDVAATDQDYAPDEDSSDSSSNNANDFDPNDASTSQRPPKTSTAHDSIEPIVYNSARTSNLMSIITNPIRTTPGSNSYNCDFCKLDHTTQCSSFISHAYVKGLLRDISLSPSLILRDDLSLKMWHWAVGQISYRPFPHPSGSLVSPIVLNHTSLNQPNLRVNPTIVSTPIDLTLENNSPKPIIVKPSSNQNSKKLIVPKSSSPSKPVVVNSCLTGSSISPIKSGNNVGSSSNGGFSDVNQDNRGSSNPNKRLLNIKNLSSNPLAEDSNQASLESPKSNKSLLNTKNLSTNSLIDNGSSNNVDQSNSQTSKLVKNLLNTKDLSSKFSVDNGSLNTDTKTSPGSSKLGKSLLNTKNLNTSIGISNSIDLSSTEPTKPTKSLLNTKNLVLRTLPIEDSRIDNTFSAPQDINLKPKPNLLRTKNLSSNHDSK